MTRLNKLALAATAATLTVPLPAAAQPGPVPGPTFEYAVKVVCGNMNPGQNPPPPVVGGIYSTAVNVHNPGVKIMFRRKVAIAPPAQGGAITGFLTFTLGTDQAVEFNCREIFEQAKIPAQGWLKGFLVLQSPRELDVVAVYTAGQLTNLQVTTMHTERVPPRRMGD